MQTLLATFYNTFLVVVDSYSKWLEVIPLSSAATAHATVDKLRTSLLYTCMVYRK